jgi:hypothetical protein
MLPQTIDLLREHDFIRGEESVNRDALADALIELLVADPVGEEAEIQPKALIIPEFRYRLFGSADVDDIENVEEEIDSVLTPLLGGEGKVQQKLRGQLVLCSAPVTRRLSNDGAAIVLKKTGRFVTADPDLMVQYYWGPAKRTLERQAAKLNYRIELSGKRQPLVAPRRAEIVTETYIQLRIQLPPAEA